MPTRLGEQVRGDDVDRQDVPAGGDAGVVDDRVHPPQAVHLAGDTARLPEVGQVPDDGRSAPVHEVADGREPVAGASVDDDLVPVVEQRLGSRPSETVCGAGDQDACHSSGGERAAWEWLQASSDTACWSASTPLGRGRGAMLVDVTSQSSGPYGSSPDRHLPVCGGAAGSCTVTQSPPAARGVRVRVPSCAWVMLLTIARPRPTPAWSVRMRSVPR
jgi:hypothetical protein